MPRYVRFRFTREYPLQRTYGGVRYRFLLANHGTLLSLIVRRDVPPPATVTLTGTFYGRWWLNNDLYRVGFEVEERSPGFRLTERLEREGYAVRAFGCGRR